MPFDVPWNYVIIAGVIVWLLCSWKLYRIIAYYPPEKRDWTDRTLPRRITWVILGPVTFAFIGAAMLLFFLSDLGKAGWKWLVKSRSSRRLQVYRRRAQIRRERFLARTPT